MSSGLSARAAVTAERDAAGQVRITRLRSDGPLALRASGCVVHLVGAGAGPLGGDDLELAVTVGPGARLDLRSAAATLLLPGHRRPGAPRSRLLVRASVAAGGRLVFSPGPLIAAAGCDHLSVADVNLDETAELVWQEQIVLGRHAERPGRYVSRFDVTVGAAPLLRHELRIDEGAASCAVLGDAKAIGTLLMAGADLTREPYAEEGLAVMPLARPGVLVTVLAADAVSLRDRMELGRSAATGR